MRWRRSRQDNPSDTEAAIFYALAIAAAASPTDKTYADLLKAGAILEEIIASQPDHPGLAHYIIHSYDVPPLADRALDAARRYAKIAPSAPHALHMPSHTFTRVGYWQDSIDTNIASGAVGEARRLDRRRTARDGLPDRTRTCRRRRTARRDDMLERLPEVNGAVRPGGRRIGRARVRRRLRPGRDPRALRARTRRLGRGGEAGAAAEPVPVRRCAHLFRQGAWRGAHRRRADGTRSAIEALTTIQAAADAEQKELYWAEQTEIQRRSASAWLALVEGRKTDALAEMRAAAAIEDGTEKSAVTPGPLAPARELVGEMLLELNQPADALKEFEATLKKEPNRFRALSGAARSAALAGDRVKARTYSASLLRICERAETAGRPELVQARQWAGK